MARRKTRRANGEGTIYFDEKRGRWVAQVTVGRHPDGRIKRRTLRGKTRREVKEKLDDIGESRRKGTYTDPTRETVGEYLQRWLSDYAAQSVKPTSLENYRTNVRNHIIPDLGHIELRALRTRDVQAFYKAKLQNGNKRNGSGLSPRMVRYLHTLLRAALKQAVAEGLIATNPTDAAKPPGKRRRAGEKEDGIRPFTREEQAAFLSGAEDDEWFTAWHLFLATGLRRGELLALKWSDIELPARDEPNAGGVLRVRRNLVLLNGRPTFSDVKTKKARRTVDFGPETVAVLRAHRARQAEQRMRLGPDYEDGDLVFCLPDGRPMDPRALLRRLTRLLDRLELPQVSVHDLRHTHATRLLEAGVHPKVVQERLGHSSISVTMDTYSHVMPTMQKDAAAKMDDILAGRG